MKTSIKIKKFWFSDIAPDGGMGTNWVEIQIGQREATVKFNGSDATTTNHKNVLGSILESSSSKGDKTLNFQFADLTPAIIAEFVGGTVSANAAARSYDAPLNENQVVEKSIKFLTEKNVLCRLPRVAFDGYPVINDDDLHYYQMNGTVLKPEKEDLSTYGYDELLQPDANDILSFVLEEQTGAAVISAVNHTVAITVEVGTSKTALTPVIGLSLGASITPNSGETEDFTNPVVYSVESASGVKQNWTVTVTVAT